MSADPSKADIITRLAVLAFAATDNLANTTELIAIGEQMSDYMDRDPPPREIEELAREVALHLLGAAQHMASALTSLEKLAPLLNTTGGADSVH